MVHTESWEAKEMVTAVAVALAVALEAVTSLAESSLVALTVMVVLVVGKFVSW